MGTYRLAIIWLACVVAFCGVVAGIVVGGQNLGWWMQTREVNKQAQIQQGNYGTQLTEFQKLQSDYQGFITAQGNLAHDVPGSSQYAADAAELKGLGNIVCGDASMMTTTFKLPESMSVWIHGNCSNGVYTK